MESKRAILLLIALLALLGIPFVVIYPSGSASAGLSQGFLGIMDNVARLLLVAPVGIAASCLRGDGRVVLPFSFLLMYLIGAMLGMDMAMYPMVRLFILGAILTFGLALSVADSRLFFVSVFLGASVAFHLGGMGMQDLPALASPLYFIIGQVLALVIVLATSFSIGLITVSERLGIVPRTDVSARLPDRR